MLISAWKKAVKENNAESIQNLSKFFLDCREGKKTSLWKMTSKAFKEVESQLGKVDLKPLELACNAAEKHSDNAYHNEYHNREVTLVTTLLLLKHLRDGNEAGFTARDARNLIMAAAIHDLDHDGTGNKVDGKHQPLRLENKSLIAAANVWKFQDVDKNDMDFIRACVEATDISKPDQGLSPRGYLIESFNAVNDNTPKAYANKKWRIAAAMLSDADLSPSGAISPEMFTVNSKILETETKGAVPATPASAKFFLNNVLTSFPLSPEGGKLLQSGYNKIKASVGI